MNEKQMLDWIEEVGAQLWKDRARNWTVQVITAGSIIQPTRATLRAAITDAHSEWKEKQKGKTE